MRNLHLILPAAQFAKPVTPRELAVAERVTYCNKEIAAMLDISPETVAAHLANIRRKTGLGSRAEIAVWADRQSRSTEVTPILDATGRRAA